MKCVALYECADNVLSQYAVREDGAVFKRHNDSPNGIRWTHWRRCAKDFTESDILIRVRRTLITPTPRLRLPKE